MPKEFKNKSLGQQNSGVGHNTRNRNSADIISREWIKPDIIELPDSLAGLTKKQIWHDCVWLSKESAHVKLVLQCIGRFFEPDGTASSMSYAQMERDCSLSDSAVKRSAKVARDRWLKIEVYKGIRTASGPQNLYHAICPPDLVAELRAVRAKCRFNDHQGVAGNNPKGCQADTSQSKGVSNRPPRGVPQTPLLSNTHYHHQDKNRETRARENVSCATLRNGSAVTTSPVLVGDVLPPERVVVSDTYHAAVCNWLGTDTAFPREVANGQLDTLRLALARRFEEDVVEAAIAEMLGTISAKAIDVSAERGPRSVASVYNYAKATATSAAERIEKANLERAAMTAKSQGGGRCLGGDPV